MTDHPHHTPPISRQMVSRASPLAYRRDASLPNGIVTDPNECGHNHELGSVTSGGIGVETGVYCPNEPADLSGSAWPASHHVAPGGHLSVNSGTAGGPSAIPTGAICDTYRCKSVICGLQLDHMTPSGSTRVAEGALARSIGRMVMGWPSISDSRQDEAGAKKWVRHRRQVCWTRVSPCDRPSLIFNFHRKSWNA
jgi:hypothetical protein